MAKALYTVLVFLSLTGVASAGEHCAFSKHKGSYDRSGRVTSTGPASLKDSKMCAMEGHDHEKSAQGEETGKEGSEKEGCCSHH